MPCLLVPDLQLLASDFWVIHDVYIWSQTHLFQFQLDLSVYTSQPRRGRSRVWDLFSLRRFKLTSHFLETALTTTVISFVEKCSLCGKRYKNQGNKKRGNRKKYISVNWGYDTQLVGGIVCAF